MQAASGVQGHGVEQSSRNWTRVIHQYCKCSKLRRQTHSAGKDLMRQIELRSEQDVRIYQLKHQPIVRWYAPGACILGNCGRRSPRNNSAKCNSSLIVVVRWANSWWWMNAISSALMVLSLLRRRIWYSKLNPFLFAERHFWRQSQAQLYLGSTRFLNDSIQNFFNY